jgi:hypothetical protein
MATADPTSEGRQLLDINLIDDPKPKGQSRTKLGDGRYVSEVSDFSITVRELCAAHGTWEKDKTPQEKASLLVLRFQILDHDPSRGRRFKSVRVGIRFSSAVEGASIKDDPYLSNFAPAKDGTIGFVSTTVLRSKKKSGEISLDIDADPSPVVLGAKLAVESGWEWERDVTATMSAFAKPLPYNKTRLGENYVEWVIGENKFAKKIADSYDVAILLRRPDNSPFKMEFPMVKAHIDVRYLLAAATSKAGEYAKDYFGLTDPETDLPKSYTYFPDVQGTHPDKPNFKSDDLHLLEQGAALEEYAFIRVLGEVRGVAGAEPPSGP